MITVEDVLKSIPNEPKFKPLQSQLERFSPGTPIRGHNTTEIATGGTLAGVSFDENTQVRMDNGEVVLE